MERETNPVPSNDHQVVIDIPSRADVPFPNTSDDHNVSGLPQVQNAEQPSSSVRVAENQAEFSSFNGGSNPRNLSLVRGASGRTQNRSPLNSGLWIPVELVLTMGQVIAAIVVLSLSRHEQPHAPLYLWVVGYASGCVATLPLLYWRYRHRNQVSQRESSQSNTSDLSMRASPTAGSAHGDVRNTNDSDSRDAVSIVTPSPRLKVLVEYYKMALDCFFAVWFVVGNVWIFGGHSSASEAPNLYRICIVFLALSCIGYAMPFILCTMICCCLPCIISVLGFREDPTQSRGATTESINSLPTYKFKMKKAKGNDKGNSSGVAEGGGVVAAGTEKERTLSGEDAVCCICLGKYANNDELKELPCSHFFHKECVDKWLKINATCPLCKAEVGQTIVQSLTEATASLRRSSLP